MTNIHITYRHFQHNSQVFINLIDISRQNIYSKDNSRQDNYRRDNSKQDNFRQDNYRQINQRHFKNFKTFHSVSDTFKNCMAFQDYQKNFKTF